MKKLIVICDRDNDYGKHLAKYLSRKKELQTFIHGDIRTFTSAEDMLIDLVGENIGFLFISLECYMDYIYSDLKPTVYVNKLVIINSERNLPESVAEECVYKYQPASLILGKILSECHDMEIDDSDESSLATVIGVYSPIKRTLKTSFSFTLAQILSEEENVLYVNLEGCSGLSQLISIDGSTNLADLLFDYSLYKSEYPGRFHKFIKRYGSLSIIPPVETISEIQCVESEEIISVLRQLKRNGTYKKVIVDIGDNVNGIIDIVGMCDTVYMPVRSDFVSLKKIELFDKALAKYENFEELASRLHKLEFPDFKGLNGSFDDLKYGEFGGYVRDFANARY